MLSGVLACFVVILVNVVASLVISVLYVVAIVIDLEGFGLATLWLC